MSPQEKKIVQFGKENGKSLTEVKAAIANYRKEQASVQVSPEIQRTNEAAQDPFLQQVGTGAAKEFAKTGIGIGSIGRKIQTGISKGADALFGTKGFGLGGESVFDDGQKKVEAKEFLQPVTGVEKLGSFGAGVATFAVPGGAAARATKGAGLARRAGTLGAVDFGVEATREGEINRDALMAGGVGAALPVGGALVRTATDYGGNVLKNLAGTVSGTGRDTIDRALKTPQSAQQGLKMVDEAALKETATAVRSGVKKLRQNASEEYGQLVKPVTGKLDKNKIVKATDNIFVEQADARITKNGLDISNTPLNDVEERQLQKIYNVINTWDDFSPQGVNTLATRISRFRRGSQDSQNFDRIVDEVRRSVRTQVGDQFPEIAEANAKFAARMDLIDDLDSILSARGAVDSQQGIRETSQRVARLFNSNKELAREAVESLEKELGIDVLGVEAGRRLSDNASLFQVGAQDSAMGLVRSLVPRSVIGSMVVQTGKSQQAVEAALAGSLSGLEPTAQAAVVETLVNLYGTE